MCDSSSLQSARDASEVSGNAGLEALSFPAGNVTESRTIQKTNQLIYHVGKNKRGKGKLQNRILGDST